MTTTPDTIPDRAELPPLPEPIEINWPTMHASGLGCGVEDRGLRGRYECAEYGWQEGVDAAADSVPEEIYTADQMREYALAARSLAGTPQAEPLKAAPDAVSEREAFEAWIAKESGDLSTFGRGANLHYRNSAVNNAWTGWDARSRLSTTQQAAKSAAALGLVERLKNEAQIHAGEARATNATVAEIYRIVSGGTGEPGNWHGAEPVRKCIEELRSQVAAHSAAPAAVGEHRARLLFLADCIDRNPRIEHDADDATYFRELAAFFSAPMPATQAPAAVGKREAFEAWATSKKWDIARYEDGQYVASYARDGWDAYQAALMPAGAAVGEPAYNRRDEWTHEYRRLNPESMWFGCDAQEAERFNFQPERYEARKRAATTPTTGGEHD